MADITLAFSLKGISEILGALTKMAAGTVTASFELNENVVVDVNASWRIPQTFKVKFDDNPDAIKLSELDLVFDVLDFNFRIALPPVTIGGNCVVTPLGPCTFRLPEHTLFRSDEDFSIPVRFGGVRAEISGEMDLNVVLFKAADAELEDLVARTFRDNLLAGLEDLAPDAPPEVLDFFRSATKDGWELRAEPHWADLDVLDTADITGDSLKRQLDTGFKRVGNGLPPDVQLIISQTNTSLEKIVRSVADIPDDLQEFLLDAFTSMQIVDKALEELSNKLGFLYLVKIPEKPTFQFHENLPPVSIQVTRGSVDVEPKELTIDLDIAEPEL